VILTNHPMQMGSPAGPGPHAQLNSLPALVASDDY